MTDTLLGALLAFQGEAPSLQKDKINPAFKSKYISLGGLMEQVLPSLVKHGLIWTTLPTSDEQGNPALLYRLVHAKTGEAIDGTMPLLLDKQNPQGLGSALTYARRQSIMAVLGLVADEDDDGNKASSSQRNGQTQAPRPQPQAAPNGGSERAASAPQRGLIFARADEHKLPNSGLANVVLAATGNEPRDFESEDHAGEWLKRSLDRLPARKVNDVLEGIEKTGALL